MQILDELGIQVSPLEDLWRDRYRPGGASAQVAITFDDGFRSVFEHAMPILEQHRFAATVFVVSDYCGKTNDWPGQARGIAPRSLMTWSEARESISRGISFQCHTRTHPDLTRLSLDVAEAELVGSKYRIEDALGAPVRALAYPYGAHNWAIRRLAARYFPLACTTRLAFVDPDCNPLAIDRIEMFYLRSPERFRQILTWRSRAHLAIRRVIRALRAAPYQPAWGRLRST